MSGAVGPTGHGRRLRDGEADVSASELASYVYCAKAWHLERVVGAAASLDARSARASGVTRHVRHGRRVRLFRRRRALAWWAAVCLLAAAVLLLLALRAGAEAAGA